MTEYEKFYRENLYPFQDGILAIARHIDVPFYLTGGTALSRHYSPVRYSDDLDLWTLARIRRFNWAEIIREASSKEAGLDPILLYDLLKSFPREELSSIQWIKPEPDEDLIMADLKVMADEMFEGRENTLAADS